MNFRFEQLESLHWLWLVLAMALMLAWSWRARQRAFALFADLSLLKRLAPQASLGRWIVQGVLRLVAMILIVGALLDPRAGVKYQDVKRRGIDILFVVDVSRSMLAHDVKPNRLERAKQFIGDTVEALAGDRVGLLSFAGVAAVKCPLTVDYGAFRLSLNELTTESSARGGSLLGDALRLAGDSFTDESKDFKCVIVLSDGEDHDSYPVEAAQKLLDEKGVRTFTVGIGDSNEGARIPLNGGYVTHQGQEVWSKMDATVLREAALAGGGAFVPAGTSTANMADVYQQKIASAGGTDSQTSRIKLYEPQYQWPAGAALVILLIESWMSLRRSKRADDESEGVMAQS
jgi:Ca-activated chloride channel homolog